MGHMHAFTCVRVLFAHLVLELPAALLLSQVQQPHGQQRVRPHLPVLEFGALAFPRKTVGPAIAPPTPSTVSLVILALGLGGRVDEERLPVHLHLDIRCAA
eukprot:457550-Rhodomonas_salina.1